MRNPVHALEEWMKKEDIKWYQLLALPVTIPIALCLAVIFWFLWLIREVVWVIPKDIINFLWMREPKEEI